MSGSGEHHTSYRPLETLWWETLRSHPLSTSTPTDALPFLENWRATVHNLSCSLLTEQSTMIYHHPSQKLIISHLSLLLTAELQWLDRAIEHLRKGEQGQELTRPAKGDDSCGK